MPNSAIDTDSLKRRFLCFGSPVMANVRLSISPSTKDLAMEVKLSKQQKVTVNGSENTYLIMRQILRRENKIWSRSGTLLDGGSESSKQNPLYRVGRSGIFQHGEHQPQRSLPHGDLQAGRSGDRSFFTAHSPNIWLQATQCRDPAPQQLSSSVPRGIGHLSLPLAVRKLWSSTPYNNALCT